MKLLTVPALSVQDGGAPLAVPDIPPGVAHCGQYDPKTDTYLVAVPDAAVVSAKAGRTALSTRKAQTAAMAARELSEAAVNSWRVG